LVLRRLGDRHCRLELTKELADRESLRRAERHLPPVKLEAKVISPFRERTQAEGELISEKSRKYGFLVVPMFTQGDPTNFATAIQSEIRRLLAQRPCGWIVDLRGIGAAICGLCWRARTSSRSRSSWRIFGPKRRRV